jgi:hypothetical protein
MSGKPQLVFECIQDIVCHECKCPVEICDEDDGDDLVCHETYSFRCKSCYNFYTCCEHCSNFMQPSDYDYYLDGSHFKAIPVTEIKKNSGKIYLQKFIGYSGSTSNNTLNMRFNTVDPSIVNKHINDELWDYNYTIKQNNILYELGKPVYIPINENELQKNPDETFENTAVWIEFYVGDKDLYYFNNIHVDNIDLTNAILTGPDGGLAHYWKCENCGKIKEYTDK